MFVKCSNLAGNFANSRRLKPKIFYNKRIMEQCGGPARDGHINKRTSRQLTIEQTTVVTSNISNFHVRKQI